VIKHKETAGEWENNPLSPKSVITEAGITEVYLFGRSEEKKTFFSFHGL
jgi:hypothetical protein